MSKTAGKVLSFPTSVSKPQLLRDEVTTQLRNMLKSDEIPPKGDPTRGEIVKERQAFYKNLLHADNPKLTHNDWMIIFANCYLT